MTEAFITSPILRSHQTSEVQRKITANLRYKIISILKSFTEKEILFQAVNNISIPKNFTNIAFIETRPDEELNKIHSAVCALKKEVLRIKRYSDNLFLNKVLGLQSIKSTNQRANQHQGQKYQNRNLNFLKRQISSQKRIKGAIEQELKYRQKLLDRDKKAQQSIKLRSEFYQKRKQVARSINKKAMEVYQRQKQIQQKWFDKVISSQPSDSKEFPNNSNYQAPNTMRHSQNYEQVKQRIEKLKFDFEQKLNEQEVLRVNRQNSLKQFKHRRLTSLNEKMIYRSLKSQQIRERKHNQSQEEQKQKIKKMIQKQIKIQQTRQHKTTKHTSNTQGPNKTCTLLSNMNPFRDSDMQSIDYSKEDQKENRILEKISRKNQIKKNLINSKIQQLKEKHQIQQSRRQAFKKSHLNLITQSSTSNESFVYQRDFRKHTLTFKQVQTPSDPQQQLIKKKHDKLLKATFCDQTIMRLRKLPKSVLQKKLNDFKTKELQDIFAENIVKLLN